MIQILGVLYCLNADIYTFSKDCAASRVQFTMLSVPEYVCSEKQTKQYYAIRAAENFSKKDEKEITVMRAACIVPAL